jgi:hypothetical protein
MAKKPDTSFNFGANVKPKKKGIDGGGKKRRRGGPKQRARNNALRASWS